MADVLNLGFTQLYLGNTLARYAAFFAIIIVGAVAGKLVTWLTKTFVRSFADKTETNFDDLLVSLLEGPLILTIVIVTLYFAQGVLQMSEGFAGVYEKILAILFTANLAWYLMRFLNGVIRLYVQPMTSKTKTDLDDHLIPLLRKLVNFVIIAIAVIMIIDRLGYNVSSLVAGLGIGGLAFALAAQDLIGNLFGGVAIIVDKPFKIGDRVKVGTDIDGFVREIGLRTTRVETFGGTRIIVPNSRMVDSIVENVSKEKKRRMNITIGVEYSTSSAKLEEAKKLILKNIKATEGLDAECSVSFKEFADSSLNLNVIYWITKEGMDDYWGVQDRLLSAIKRDFEKARISMAFPTRTVHLVK